MSQFNTQLWSGGTPPAGTLAVSGRNLIYQALRSLGVLRPGQTANPESYEDGFTALNQMVDSWATERLLVRVVGRELVTMTGVATYTAAPHRIERAGYVNTAGHESEIEILTLGKWARIHDKAQTGEPYSLYVEATFPDATLYPHPIPASGSLAIYQWRVLDQFADIETQYAFPAGYALALRWNLAWAIAPEFVVLMKTSGISPEHVERKAVEYKAAIKRLNAPLEEMSCDSAVLGGGTFDILTGRYE